MILRTLIIACGMLSLPISAHASSFSSGWSGEASLSGSVTTGNTETTDVGLALHLGKESGLWKHNFDATYDYGKAAKVDNKNRLFLGYKLDRQINDRLYGYGNVNYFQDDFGSYEKGYFAGGGLGYKLMPNEPTLWDVEGGIGYRSQTPQGTNMDDNEFAIRGASYFDHKFNDAVAFYNDTEVIWSSSDTYIWNDIGITANLAGNLAARFSFRVDHHTDVPVGIEKTDTVTRAALVYTID